MSLLFVFIGLAGCHAPSSRWNSSEGFQTQIVVTTSFNTKFETVTLQGVENQKTLAGSIVQFFYSPGEQVHQNELRLKGQPPQGRFIRNSKGVFIPADVLTMQMVTIYYHLQELKKLEEKARGRSLLKWPRQVGLQVNTADLQTKYDNAFYNNVLDALFFVPYTKSNTPTTINPGVIAHEHFHSYFAYQVMNPLMQEGQMQSIEDFKKVSSAAVKNYLFWDVVLKSLNEGLADVWGWIYSQDPDFVALSLPSLRNGRSLEYDKITQIQIAAEQMIKDQVDAGYEACLGNDGCESPVVYTTADAYLFGATLARTLKNFAMTRKVQHGFNEEQVRLDMAQKMFLFLDEIKAGAASRQLNLEKAIVIWSKLYSNLSEQECASLKDVLPSSIEKQKICLK